MENIISTPEYYVSQSKLSDPGRYLEHFKSLPTEIEQLSDVVHGLLVHPSAMKKIYGLQIPETRRSEPNIHFIEDILEQIVELNNSELQTRRSPEQRFICLCRNFALLATSILRSKNIPARVRVGFATYWSSELNDDHWVTEYWNEQQGRWVMFDANIGNEEKEYYDIKFDSSDLTSEQFILAGKAWELCRQKKAGPDNFGTNIPGIKGWWFIRANLLRDLAALNKIELQPWDYTEFSDIQIKDLSELSEEEIKLLDDIAKVTQSDDIAVIQEIYLSNPQVQVGQEVTSYPGSKPIKVSLQR